MIRGTEMVISIQVVGYTCENMNLQKNPYYNVMIAKDWTLNWPSSNVRNHVSLLFSKKPRVLEKSGFFLYYNYYMNLLFFFLL